MHQLRDKLPGLKGKVELFVTEGAPKLVNGNWINTPEALEKTSPYLAKLMREGRLPKQYDSCVIDFSKTKELQKAQVYNIILDQGKDKVITSLATGFINVICRMAVGDRGTLPSDQTVPKVPTSDMTALYNEVYRSDVDSTVLDVGGLVHEIKFVKTFSATVVPITSFSNQANPIVNEVGLVTADLLSGNPLPRPDVAAPAASDADEKIFSIRTFKSVPFQAANEIAVTIRYTIFIE